MTVVRSGAASDVGRVRIVNQDMVLQTPTLFAVADGMGGHAGGDVAAKVAIDTLKAAFGRQASTEGLEKAVIDANTAVWSQGHTISDLRGMGTTLTAAALVVGSDGRDKVALANVGDSRAYLFTAGQLTQITVDHSLAEEKVRFGEMTEAEAAVHPHRHILTRALGVTDAVEVDLWELHLRTGDRLLLCSDGLTNEVLESEIARVLSSEPDPETVAKSLVGAANQHGGNDNISVLVVDVLVGDDEVATADVIAPRRARPVDKARSGTGVGAVAWTGSDASPTSGPAVAEQELTAMTLANAPSGDVADVADTAGPGPSAPAAGEPDPGAGSSGAPPGGPVLRTDVGGPLSATSLAEMPRESRRERKRRLGVPRRITLRVLGFVVLLALVVAAAYMVVRWYATDNWYVTVHDSELVIYQGRPGGLLWFQPKVVDRTGVSTSDVLPIHLGDLRATVQEPSLAAAKRYVTDLRREYSSEQGNSLPPTTAAPPGSPTSAPAAASTSSP